MTTASLTRRPALFFAAVCASVLLLLTPALWNGFPLLEYDTGGYFARWYEGTLEVSRSTVYGLFLVLLARPDFWPAVVVQSALTVWLIALVLRVLGLGGRPWALFGTVAVLCVGTTLPWITGILLTDIFAGLSVLALYLIVLRADALATWERMVLLVLVAFSAATHSATLAVLVGLLVVGLVVFLFKRPLVPVAGLARGVIAILLGAIMLVAANYAVAGRLAWTPGGIALSFGRMLQDGIVARFLAEHCPDPRFRLCDHRAELPTDADTFFWGESIFDQLGRFDGMGEEMRTIVLDSVAAYPLWQLEAAAIASGRQLLKVATGEGVLNSVWHTHGMIENFLPSALPAMRAARQQKGEIDFRTINRAAPAGGVRLHGAADRRDRADAARSIVCRPCATGHHGCARDHGERSSVRRIRQSARPLWRAHGLARHPHCRCRDLADGRSHAGFAGLSAMSDR